MKKRNLGLEEEGVLTNSKKQTEGWYSPNYNEEYYPPH